MAFAMFRSDYMANKKIGAYITLDGEREFRSAVTSCNKSLSTMHSEMKLVEAQTTGQANTLETLEKKHEILVKTLDEQKNKEEAVRTGLRHAEQEYSRIGNELEQYKEKLLEARSTLQDMENSSDTTEEALNEQRQAVSDLSGVVEKGEATYQRAGNKVQDWKKQLNNAEAQTIRATRAVNENTAYMKEAEAASDGCAKSIDEFGNHASQLADEITSTGRIIKANLINTVVDAGKQLAGTVFKSAIDGTLKLQDAQNQLQASTGATTQATKDYSRQMQELYASGYGDDINGIANAMALVKQYTNETDPTKIQKLAESGIALEDIFNMDLSESIRGIDALMDDMGLGAEEAFDYVAKGAQNGLNKSSELGDNLAEYVSLWAQAGFSAEEMFTILQNGLDSGAYNLDKVNDYVKEFGNSMADGRIESNLSAFSAGTQDLFQEWKNGNATTSEVFKSVISDLANMENQQQALTIASNTWSALGEDNAMKVITSLYNVNSTYKNVQGTMEDIKRIKYDSVSNEWKVLGRTFQTDVMQPILVKFLPAAQKGMKALAENIDVIVPVATAAGTAIGTLFVVNKSRKFISELKETGKSISGLVTKVLEHSAAKAADTAVESASTAATTAQTAATVAQTTATAAQTAATTTATAAQGGLNAIMAANPVGLVVAGVAALVAVTAVFASNVDVAKTKTDELGEKADKLNEKAESAANGLEQATGKMSTSMGKVEASAEVARSLKQELEGLAGQSSRTASEQSRMETIVMELNSIFPEMGLAVDDVTGKLNMSASEMDNYINTAIQMQKVQAAQEAMKESVEKLVDAEIAQAEAAKSLSDIENELGNIQAKRSEVNDAITEKNESLKQAQKDYNKALREGAENADELYAATQDQSEATIEYNGKILSVSEALRQMTEDEEALNEKKQESKEALGNVNDAIDEANDKMEPYTEYLTGMTEATENNTEKTQANSRAKEENAEKAQANIEMSGQELEAYNNLSASQQELAVNVTNSVISMQENVQNALASQMDMFEQFDGGAQISTEQLLSNMQSQVDGVTAWEQNLSSLADRGINQGILQKLAEMGPQGSGYVAAFNSMTDEELSKANDLWSQSVDIQGMTNDWGQQLLTSGAANIAGGMQNLTSVMQQSGANTVMGLVQGLQNAQDQAATAGRDLGVKTIEAVDNGLGCHSPSTKTMESGRNVNVGLAMGMSTSISVAQAVARSTSESVTNIVSNMLKAERFVQYGRNVSTGLAQGISAGKSQVIQAAIDVAGAAITAAQEKLEINSPSKAFRRIGESTMEGFVLGVERTSNTARKAVSGAVDFGDIEGRIDRKSGRMGEAEYTMLNKIVNNAVRQAKFAVYLNGRDVTRELSDLGVVFSA